MNTSPKSTSLFHHCILWFGAAVSIAEIEAGMQVASLSANGSSNRLLLAVLLGHLLGGFLLFAAGVLGARLRCNAMECVSRSFGSWGGGFFAIANILQLLGWTAVMVTQGADAVRALFPDVSLAIPAMGIGALVVAWIFIGLGSGKLGGIAASLLFVVTLLLTGSVFRLEGALPTEVGGAADSVSFWSALELSVAMPVSWLPLIADYTQNARKPVAASAVSALVYTLVSTWMYGIGLFAGLHSEAQTLADVLRITGIGVAGLLVVVFSTVTTTFLDAYSAGESAKSILPRLSAKAVGVGVAVLGTVLAVVGVMDRYTDFLYLIASVFAPMAAVLLWDAFARSGRPLTRGVMVLNGVAWLVGFAVYHLLLRVESPFGASLPSMAIAVLLRWGIGVGMARARA